MTHDEAIDWLYGTQLFGIKLGLDAVHRLLDELEVPTGRIGGRTIVHVAGTNGKGSVCAMIESIARHSGQRTALFTSPHLVEFRERVRVDGEKIPAAEVARLLREIRELVADWDPHPTFFEITLAMAAKYFAESKADFWVLETGMGGRLDATNVFESDVAVLTPIALDHQQWLGDTLGEIAAEKAGIIKPGARVFSSPQADQAMASILAVRGEVDVVEDKIPADWSLGLCGPHQRQNAALAVAVAQSLIEECDETAIRDALAKVSWPGRFQRLDDDQLILDGAHNPGAAKVLVAVWREVFGEAEKAVIILGATGTKDVDGLLDELCKIAARFIFVPIKSQRGLSPDDLMGRLGDRCPAAMAESLSDAMQGSQRSANAKTLVCGSLFLVGEALALRKGASKVRESEQ
jgi:dihydrofolate synthase/folylpolyglutamate synthase